MQPDDNEMLMRFQSWVNSYNKYIQESYERNANSNPIAPDEAEVIEAFITVEDEN